MGFATIQVELDGPAGVIRMNRPEKYNALSRELMAELEQALDALEQDSEVRGVILTGTDKFFSTGGDLNETVQVVAPLDWLNYNRQWRTLNRKIEHLFKPVIAAIGGYCLTGGLEVALACDIRIAAENAQFGITSAKIGSVAGAGGTQRLPRLVGPAVARELLFTANFIDAAEAYRIGLVNNVVPVGQVVPKAKEMVATFAQRGPLSLAWLKLAVNTGMNLDLESALDFEAALVGEAFMTADKEEGMRAFLEKRVAVFQGR